MSLKGNLDPAFMSSLFQIYCDEKKTGLFTAECDGLQVQIHIQDGVIVHAAGFGPAPLLTDLLRHRGILPTEQVDQVTAAAAESGRPVCRTVLEMGLMQQADLVPILESLADDLMLHLFQQTQGEFEYRDLPELTDDRVFIRKEIRRVIFDTFRLLDELKEMQKKLPDEETQFVMAQAKRPNTAYQLDAVAWRILSLIHAKQTLKEIVRQSTYNPHEVYMALLALLDAGMIAFSSAWEDEIHSMAPPEPDASTPNDDPDKPKEKKLFGLFKKKKSGESV